MLSSPYHVLTGTMRPLAIVIDDRRISLTTAVP